MFMFIVMLNAFEESRRPTGRLVTRVLRCMTMFIFVKIGSACIQLQAYRDSLESTDPFFPFIRDSSREA